MFRVAEFYHSTTDTKVFLLAFETTCRMLHLWTVCVGTINGKTDLCHVRRVLFSSYLNVSEVQREEVNVYWPIYSLLQKLLLGTSIFLSVKAGLIFSKQISIFSSQQVKNFYYCFYWKLWTSQTRKYLLKTVVLCEFPN